MRSSLLRMDADSRSLVHSSQLWLFAAEVTISRLSPGQTKNVAVHRCSCAYGSANYARTDAPANCGPVVFHATVPDLYPLGAA